MLICCRVHPKVLYRIEKPQQILKIRGKADLLYLYYDKMFYQRKSVECNLKFIGKDVKKEHDYDGKRGNPSKTT